MASKTKIYIVLELLDGGELFDKIVSLTYSTFLIYMFVFFYLVLSIFFTFLVF